jgi:predicted  nucleic acid-binding Zn-ribbon protein
MSVAKQLYQLQDTDLEIESKEQALQRIASQLGEDRAVARVKARLAQENQNLEELKRQQHSVEWEIDDLVTKITPAEETLYSGRIKNPKELANLQHEVEALKARRNQLEDKALEIMDRAELTEASVAAINSELKTVEADWHRQQQQLSAEAEELKNSLSHLEHRRQSLLSEIEPRIAEFYQELRRKRGRAVARVEQGICSSCRISLPISDLQRARSGDLVQCSSCGRILFQA